LPLYPSLALVVLSNLLGILGSSIAVGEAAPFPALPPPSTEPAHSEAATAAMIALINGERQRQGLRALEVSDELTVAASVRVQEVEDRFSHDRPESTLEELLNETTVEWSVAAETLATAVDGDAMMAADQAYRGLMSSSTHRSILLSQEYCRIGVATGQSRGRWLFVDLVAD
jgi:uncharacterized protein YkwD